MKSEWRVTSNIIDGRKMYGVYRLYDRQKIDHSGNREELDRWFDDRELAEDICRILNEDGDR